MDDFRKQNLKGSPSRDEFKRRHKDLAKDLYGLDLDFVIVEKVPHPDIVAVFDYKTDSDKICFTEVLAYGALVRRGIEVFIIQGNATTGSFVISQFIGGNHKEPRSALKEKAITKDWAEFEQWERKLRTWFRNRWGD